MMTLLGASIISGLLAAFILCLRAPVICGQPFVEVNFQAPTASISRSADDLSIDGNTLLIRDSSKGILM